MNFGFKLGWPFFKVRKPVSRSARTPKLTVSLLNTKDRLWAHSQTPRTELEMWRLADYFWRTSILSWVLDIPSQSKLRPCPFSDSNIFPPLRSVFKSNSPVHTHPIWGGGGSSTLKCVQSMRNKAWDSSTYALLLLLCRHIGLLFGKRLDTNLQHHRIRKYPDLPLHELSASLRI